MIRTPILHPAHSLPPMYTVGMKKIIIILALVMGVALCSAEEYEDCFTWAEYEMYCDNPQCYGDDSGAIALSLF